MRIDKRKCDRCDVEYDPEPNMIPNTTIIPTKYISVKNTLFGNTVELRITDLCSSCFKSLQDWWDGIVKK